MLAVKYKVRREMFIYLAIHILLVRRRTIYCWYDDSKDALTEVDLHDFLFNVCYLYIVHCLCN